MVPASSPRSLSRRTFLGAAAAGTASVLATPLLAKAQTSGQPVFRHGVASGDPLRDRVIIWTRVTPTADATPGSGKGAPVTVRWEVAADRAFTAILRAGTVSTSAASDHTVKVDVTGLSPAVDHWYRFSALGATSPVGRTRTAPAPGAALDSIRLGVLTCSELEFGYFGAYRHLAARDDVDAVLHLGDYIYEFGIGYGAPPAATPTPGPAIGRGHLPPHECVTLADYRTRYGQYRTDADLQLLHAAHPMIAMYDDHEVANDTWKDGAANHQPEEGSFTTRAAAGRQAWREWLPVRQVSSDPELVHRSFRFGDLVELWMLDERRYRDKQPQNLVLGYGSIDPASEDPARTMLGTVQRDWLLGGVRGSSAAWKALGNPVQMAPIVVGPALLAALTATFGPVPPPGLPLPPPLYVDAWDGYAAERRTLLNAVALSKADVVVLTGDYHESFVADLPTAPASYVLDGNSAAVEFIVPPVTAPGLAELLERGGLPNGDAADVAFETNLTINNPWFKYHEGRSSGFARRRVHQGRRGNATSSLCSDKLDRASAGGSGQLMAGEAGHGQSRPRTWPAGRQSPLCRRVNAGCESRRQATRCPGRDRRRPVRCCPPRPRRLPRWRAARVNRGAR